MLKATRPLTDPIRCTALHGRSQRQDPAALGKVGVVAGRSAIGLDIGTSGVRAAELSFGKSQVTLEKFGQVALPEGAVRDGEVVDPSAVGEAIKQLWTHTKFSSKKVVIGVANQKVIVRQVDLPWLPDDEVKQSLGFQVQDFVPMPVEHAVLDFFTLEEFTNDNGGRMRRGMLVAASREMVMNAVHAVEKAGLTATSVDLSSFAVLRSLANADHLGMGGEVEALVDVGARVTNIVVHQGGAPRFIRILLMGGQDLTDAVAERMGVSNPQAEAVKQELGLTPNVPEQSVIASRVLESSAARLVDEIRGSLDYYTASTASVHISRIVLTGGGARLIGLAEALGNATRTPVVSGNPMDGMAVGRTGLSPEQITFVQPLAVVPVGLALGALS
jgi:type IV pilus assembly protein PilM